MEMLFGFGQVQVAAISLIDRVACASLAGRSVALAPPRQLA
jgi:hypothetical protein